MKLVFFGLSLSSSWGNGHATTYRGLLKALHARGHEILFYEADVPWYADHRDLPDPDYCTLRLYGSLDEIVEADLSDADAVIIGSFVQQSDALVDLVERSGAPRLAYYDIDTPVTVAKLDAGGAEYLAPSTIPRFDIYFSFTGGPILKRLQERYGARNVCLLGCSADPTVYHPIDASRPYALGYLGTYDPSRQPTLDRLLIEPARRMPNERFIVAGPQYPTDISWPSNIDRIDHLPPSRHAEFYNSLRFALNVTRADMVAAGYSPSVRLFEAAACGRPVITDAWPGLEAFFAPDREALVARTAEDVVALLAIDDAQAEAIGEAGLRRVLKDHTGDARAQTLEDALFASSGNAREAIG
jgi:spore maturation protein CgeB